MSFPLFANIVTTILCLAVLVQSVRMMRSLKAVGNDQLTSVVTALDESTTQARMVLSNLKHTLEGDFAGSVKLVLEGREIRDELKMLIEIANSMAERLCDSSRPVAEPEPQPTFEAPAPRPVERAPEPLVINLAPEPAEPVASEPPVRAPRAAAKPMNKDDIAASLAELRAVLSRPARPTVSAEAQAEAA
jgi:hypothetical protein